MSALLRKCFDDWQCCASSATGPSTEAELIRQKTGQNLVALTSTFSVELPGIEDAYNASELHKSDRARHEATWENTAELENVLTRVSTGRAVHSPCRFQRAR